MKRGNMDFKGYNGQIEFDGNFVIIRRKGGMALLSQGMKGDKKIPVANITSVQFKTATSLVNGYIQLATSSSESRGGINAAASDENTVMFLKSQMADAEAIKDAIEAAMTERLAGGSSGTTSSAAEQLEKLAALLEKGLLTEEEFMQQKTKLLNL